MTLKQGACLEKEGLSFGLCSREHFNLLLVTVFLNAGDGTWSQVVIAAWPKVNRAWF